jgi:hypothetical protein
MQIALDFVWQSRLTLWHKPKWESEMDQGNKTEKTPLADEDEQLGPRAAAELLAQTTNQAKRQFDEWPPYLLFIGAVIFLFVYGVVWMSVRGQHPYLGPSGGALAALYGGIVVWIITVVVVLQRARGGVSGRSAQQRRTYSAGWIVIVLAYSTFQGALYHAGASHAIVYGVYPASVVWLFAGTAFVTIGVIREQSPPLALGIAFMAIGLVGAFAGPVVGWLVSGIGISVALASFGVFRIVKRRA